MLRLIFHLFREQKQKSECSRVHQKQPELCFSTAVTVTAVLTQPRCVTTLQSPGSTPSLLVAVQAVGGWLTKFRIIKLNDAQARHWDTSALSLFQLCSIILSIFVFCRGEERLPYCLTLSPRAESVTEGLNCCMRCVCAQEQGGDLAPAARAVIVAFYDRLRHRRPLLTRQLLRCRQQVTVLSFHHLAVHTPRRRLRAVGVHVRVCSGDTGRQNVRTLRRIRDARLIPQALCFGL